MNKVYVVHFNDVPQSSRAYSTLSRAKSAMLRFRSSKQIYSLVEYNQGEVVWSNEDFLAAKKQQQEKRTQKAKQLQEEIQRETEARDRRKLKELKEKYE